MKRLFLLLAFFTLVFTSCSKEDDNIDTITFHTYALIDKESSTATVTIRYLTNNGVYKETTLTQANREFSSPTYVTSDIPTETTFDKYIKVISNVGHIEGKLIVSYETPDNYNPTHIEKEFD